MPKMKSNSGAGKTFRKTASGKFKGKVLIRAIYFHQRAPREKENYVVLLWFRRRNQDV